MHNSRQNLPCIFCHVLSLFRITEWFGLKEAFKGHIAQPPCHGQEHLPLDQVTGSIIQHVVSYPQIFGSDPHTVDFQILSVPVMDGVTMSEETVSG